MHEIRSQKATESALQNLINQVRDGYRESIPLVVGIHTGGAWVATRLCETLQWAVPATLDISLWSGRFRNQWSQMFRDHRPNASAVERREYLAH